MQVAGSARIAYRRWALSVRLSPTACPSHRSPVPQTSRSGAHSTRTRHADATPARRGEQSRRRLTRELRGQQAQPGLVFVQNPEDRYRVSKDDHSRQHRRCWAVHRPRSGPGPLVASDQANGRVAVDRRRSGTAALSAPARRDGGTERSTRVAEGQRVVFVARWRSKLVLRLSNHRIDTSQFIRTRPESPGTALSADKHSNARHRREAVPRARCARSATRTGSRTQSCSARRS
jgi:hypothetical protein